MMSKRTLLAGAAAMIAGPMHAATAERRKMLITGHLGNIGSRLLPYYQETWDVSGIDKKDGPEFDLSVPAVDWLGRLIGVDTIIHLAAFALPTGELYEIYPNNVNATSNLVQAAITAKVRHIVFASSTYACPVRYGNPVGWYSTVNFYGASKVFGEGLLQNAARDGMLTASVIRVMWVPPITTDTSGAPAWLQKLLWRDAELRKAFDQGVTAKDAFVQIG